MNEEIEEIKQEIASAQEELEGLQDEYETGAFYNWQHCLTWDKPPCERFHSQETLIELISEKEREIEKLEDELYDLEQQANEEV